MTATPTHEHGNVWRIRWYAHDEEGRRVRRSKTFEAVSVRAAHLEAARIVSADGSKTTAARTVTEAVAACIDRDLAQRVGQRHIDNCRSTLRHHIESDPIGDMRFDKVGPLDVEAWARRLAAKGLGPHSTKRTMALLSAAYKAMARWGWHSGPNPVQVAHKPPIPKTTRKPPTPADVARLVVHAVDIGPEFDLFLRLSLATGLRRGELGALTWGQVDWIRQMLAIDRAVSVTSKGLIMKGTKTNRPRRIAIDDASLAALERWSMLVPSASDRFVFSTDGGFTPTKPTVWTHLFRKHCRHLGIEGVSLHSCRHWVASILLAQGIDPATVANQLGHSNITTTLDTYGHMLPGRERTVADMLGAALLPERAEEV